MKHILFLALLLSTNLIRAQWLELTSGVTDDLREVFFPVADTGYIVGMNGVVLKTVDGGDSWQSQTTGYSVDFNELYFLSTEEGWIVGDSGCICKTTNGGDNWNCTFLPGAENINLHAIYAQNSNDLIVGGQDFNGTNQGYLATSNNGGTVWTSSTYETYVWDVDIKKIGMVNATTGYAATRGDVLKTTDGGATWQITDTASVHAGTMFVLLEDLAFFPNNDTLYTCGWYGGYFGTTVNAGDEWSHNLDYQNYNMDFLNTQVGYIGGWCHIHKTTDGGATFTDVGGSMAPMFCDIFSIDFTDEMTGYACGYGGKILKTTTGGELSISELTNGNIMVSPNPTNGKISFSEPVNVTLSTLTGQRLKGLKNIGLVDISDNSAGMYLLLITNDNEDVIQRIVVVKE